jgi:hypothetical protein
MHGFKRLVVLVLASLIVLPAAARAQASIAGIVKDTSGAVLPGVTVEAASPALIEKVRSVVTDGTGQFKIVDLRPGTYAVTFTLTGFSIVKHEGVELTGSFAATVNADMKVGAVSETITVSGEAPVVDIQSTTQQRVIKSDDISALPAGRSHYDLAVLIPGLTAVQFGRTGMQDVGGTNNLQIGVFQIHGSNQLDQRLMVNGLTARNLLSSAWATNYVPDMSTTQEVSFDYSSGTAESVGSGVAINMIPKEGGNSFKVSFFGTAANDKFQGSNYTPELKAAGLSTPNSLYRVYDVDPSGGGPIMREKLWFYASARWQANENYVAGSFGNLNAGDPTKWTYVQDPSNRGLYQVTQPGGNIRLTWQASPKNKFGFSHDGQGRHWVDGRAGISPESFTDYRFNTNRFTTLTWSSPVTSRLLLDARWADHGEAFEDYLPPAGDPYHELITVTELSTGLIYRGKGHGGNPLSSFGLTNQPNIQQAQASVSYVTGSHAIKAGFQDDWGTNIGQQRDVTSGLQYTFLNGAPVSLTQRALPTQTIAQLTAELGVYAQDKWTYKRLTLNGGVRFDYFKTHFPVQTIGPGAFVPTRNLSFPETDYADMKDITPRVGAAYDLFGDGKTALKVAWGKYMNSLAPGGGNPIGNLAVLGNRAWTDGNHNFVPDCDLNYLGPLAQDHLASGGDFCGPIDNRLFGQATPSAAVDPVTYTGWGHRPWNEEFSVSVQRQIVPRVGIDVGYFRRWFGNFTVVDNRSVAASDYSTFSVTAPVDPRLPGGGGYVINGFRDLNPDKVGQVNNITTLASNFGNQWQHWNGADFSVNARPRNGVLLQGGLSTGRFTSDSCDVWARLPGTPAPALPVIAALNPYCHVEQSWQTQVKLLGTYLIPKVDVQFAATLQSSPGPNIAANFNATSAVISGLGRPLSGGATVKTVNLIPTNTLYGDRANQLDLRVSKIFRAGRTRTAVNLDLANAVNASTVLAVNTSYGAWLQPQGIIDARLVKISAQFDF